MAQEINAELDEKVRAFFDAAESYCDTRKKVFAAQHGMSKGVAGKMLPLARWRELRREWLLVRVRRVTDELLSECRFRPEFTLAGIKRRLRSLGIKEVSVARYVTAEWQARRIELPTKEEKAQEIVDRLVSQGVPAKEITVRRVREELETGLAPEAPWLIPMIRKAKVQLLKQGNSSTRQLQDAVEVRTTSSGEALSTDEIDLRRECGGRLLRRYSLRPDIAEVVWPQVCEEALNGQHAASTITRKFWEYKKAGELLGDKLPDVTKATLSEIKAAWAGYKDDGKSRRRSAFKETLMRLFTRLVMLSEVLPGIEKREMLLIAGWLSLTSPPHQTIPGNVLSADELDTVIKSCLTDVKRGLDFVAEGPEFLDLTTYETNGPNAVPFIQWGVALMILVMFLTGLRRQSVNNMRVGDWAAIHPGMYALIWRHGKKREEKVAVLPGTLAGLLDDYAQASQSLREALGTDRLFIFGDAGGCWQAEAHLASMTVRMEKFVKRHGITRAGRPVVLGSRLARRTFVTRGLYEGQSLWALRLQLGHESLRSTLHYGKFDIFEHPARVGAALDMHGRCALALWRGPVVLTTLDAPERERLLGLRPERDQGVGLCRHESCKKIDEGPLPPCSLCEHLVTGKEFFGAWEAEQSRREQGIANLEGVPGRESLLSHRRQQYALFKSNYERLKGETA